MSAMKRLYQLCLAGVCVLCITTSCACPPPEPQTLTTATEQIRFPVPTAEPTATPLPTATSLPSPAYSGTYSGTPTPNPTPADLPNGEGIETYTVQPGETLSQIALVFGCTVDEIVAANSLSSANAISAGQILYISITAMDSYSCSTAD